MPLDRATIVQLGDSLAPAAAIYARLREVLDDPDAGSDEVMHLIRMDPALTFNVIRLSNSAIFGVRGTNESLEGAVARLGMRRVLQVVGLAAAHQACQRDLMHYRLPALRLWENAVATAAAAEVLAVPNGSDPGLLYLAGLLRTLGRVIMDTYAVGRVYPGEAEWPLVAEWERQNFGLSAIEVTEILLSHWRFPEQVIDAIRSHADPLGQSEPNVGACVLNLACGVAARFGLDLPGEAGLWQINDAKLALARVTPECLEECAARAKEHYTALCAAV